jgi:nitrite reductase/ring-hydroxylating ferredoxin subunit
MYPLEDGLLYPRNQWWVAAKGNEVGRTLLQRTLLEEDVVFYRTTAGEPVALSARCPHRLLPLSQGKLRGDSIECGYHGFTFGSDGRCVFIPTQDRIPTGMRVRRYPVVEHLSWVWIWMGDPALADPAKLPRPACAVEPGWELAQGHDVLIQARYTLLLDNLFDLTHVGWVHASVFGGPDGKPPPGLDAPIEFKMEGEKLFAVRHQNGVPYDGAATMLFGPGHGLANLDALSDYYGPALSITGMVYSFEEAGAGPHAVRMGERVGGAMRILHGVTPETRYSTHYFSAHARNFRLGDAELSNGFTELDRAVRQQDADALGLIEPAAKRMKLSDEQSGVQDAAGIRVRRLLAQQIMGEMAPA